MYLQRCGKDKAQAIKMLGKIMAAWLAGTVRGFLLNWRCNYAAENAGPPVRRLVVQERRGKWLSQGSSYGIAIAQDDRRGHVGDFEYSSKAIRSESLVEGTNRIGSIT